MIKASTLVFMTVLGVGLVDECKYVRLPQART